METNHRGINPTSYATGFQNSRGFAKLKRIAAAIFAALAAGSLHAELIPAARLVNWTPGVTVGVPGGIPTNRTNLIDVTQSPYNADKTGATNAGPAIQAAINAAPLNSVIYLPAGRYRVDTSLYIDSNKDQRTLRGAGLGATVIDSRSTSGSGIYAGIGSDYMWAYPSSGNTITAGVARGSTQITIADTSAFAVGALAHLSFANDTSLPVLQVATTKNARSQKVRITGKTATTLTFSPALYTNYNPTNAKVFVAQAQTDGVGIEDLTLDCSNGQPSFGIQFDQCTDSWIKNVKIRRANSYSVYIGNSVGCEVRHSYLDEIKTNGTNGAGLLMQGSSAGLIEDNIIYKAFPLMEINFGCAGNVIAYNFLEDSTVSGVVGAGIDTNHGAHNNFNLYEGNIAPNIQADGYFGSVSDDTIMRNWLHGTSPSAAKSREAIMLQRFTRNYSVVGNMLGKPGMTFYNIDGSVAPRGPYSFGLPNMGNTGYSGTAQLSQGDPWASYAQLLSGGAPGPGGFQELDLDVEATVVLKANANLTNGTVPANESLGGDVLPNSLYLASKPSWFGSLTWPAFGPTSAAPSFASIPAGYRYLYGVDPDGQTTPTVTAPVITQQPQSQAFTAGATANFTTASSGNPAPSLQWYKDGVAISGATSATLTLTDVQSANAGGYTVIATNSAGSATSNAASLTVTASSTAPSFTTQPASVSILAGSTATFTVAASGDPAPSYQWRKDGVAISGAANATLTLNNVQPASAGSYTAVATNSTGSATSNAASLTVTATGGTAPVFTIQPTNVMVVGGTTATFTAAASGSPTYQWRKDGVAISGATSATLTLNNVQSSDAGSYTAVATNSGGSATSATAALSVGWASPAFTTQPTSRTATVGTSTTFTVTTTGYPTPVYQWRKNGVNIAGATSASYTIANVTAADAGAYSVRATNAMTEVTSNDAVLTVAQATIAPAITTQPTSRTVSTGASTTFTVAASGTPAPAYQWRKNGANIAGATSASYTIASVATTDAATYTVVATNSAGSATSNGAVLTVTVPQKAPTFTTQPTSRTVAVGTAATFTAAADGTPAPSYQWRKNGANIAGATGASYTIASAALADAATYTVVATNPKGSATSNGAVLTVNPAPAAPMFTVQPVGGTITAGTAKTFSATVTGYPAPTYQWRKNGVNIAGATSASLTIASATATDAGTYTLVATNSVTATTSANAALTVNPAAAAPVFTTQPASATIATGTAVTFTAAASGNPTPSYQWRKNGADIAGATGASYTVASATATDAATYVVVATNSAGTVASTGATLTVNSAPTASVRVDFNGDGKSDLFWQNVETGEVCIWLMSGSTYSGGAQLATMPTDWKVTGHGDFNRDGKTDLLWENLARGEYGVVFMNGATAGASVTLGATTSGHPVGAGDFDADGNTDILWQNRTTGAFSIRLMAGTTEVGRSDFGSVGAEWQVAGVGDFNGDGKTDILWTNASEQIHGAWLLNGLVYAGWADLGDLRTDATIAGTGDFNGDGKIDILWQNKTTGLREIGLMSGSTLNSVVEVGFVDVSWQIRN